MEITNFKRKIGKLGGDEGEGLRLETAFTFLSEGV